MEPTQALEGIRVLDLSDEYSHYAGKLFADLGAEVLLIEKPGGSALRHRPPFLDRIPGRRSAAFESFNTGKRSRVIDLDSPDGWHDFECLVREADLIIEDWPNDVAGRRGLSIDALAVLNPQVVLATLTPFGRTGPYANYAASDLTVLALGGFLTMVGYPDLPPHQLPQRQAIAIGSMFLAVGAMMALFAAQRDKLGQHVDVSMQECVTMATENAVQTFDLTGSVRKRFAGSQRHAGTGLFEVADGYVYLFAGGMAARRFWANIVTWLADEGEPGASALADDRWTDLSFMSSEEAKAEFNAIFAPFVRKRTKAEIYQQGRDRQVPVCPVSSPRDIAENRQMAYRGFFQQVDIAGGTFRIPGVPFIMSETPGQVSAAPELNDAGLDYQTQRRAAS
ncbi:CoA transferase [Chelativorans sp. Marseille-P2723]|uniref:CaiB/BaiF CoA transferase family protein n=1 Tax=Chelativorans sp. Marseille-P2723 TaxID=2709133 RepID=UPI00156F2E3C|nr:CoA transferase [Chelativorans sp. Marseille-P2723]